MPPPGRPMLPSNNCKMPAVRMICTPVGNDLWGVAGEVPAQNLHNAARMLQGRVARCVYYVLVWRGIWFAAAIHAVAITAVWFFRGLLLRRRLRTVLLGVAGAGLLVAPMALLGIIGVVLLVEAAKHP
jgi:hypothetical protein